jgi:hypothetical protein
MMSVSDNDGSYSNLELETDELSKSIESRPEKYRWGPDRPQSKKFIPTDKVCLTSITILLAIGTKPDVTLRQ